MKIADLPDSNVEGINIVRYKEADFQSLLKYDTDAFCYSREVYLKKMKEISNSEGWVATDKGGEIVGYVVARYTSEMHGWFLIPLIANNSSIAKALLVELSKFLIHQPVKSFSMSIPGINKNSLCLAEQFGEKQLFETRRMFAKGNPPDKMVENHANIIFAMSCAIG